MKIQAKKIKIGTAEKFKYKGLKQLYNKKFRLYFQNNISAILKLVN